MISAALSVRFRDVQHITPVFLQILFYASPVAYQTGAVPEKWRGVFLLNPLAPLIKVCGGAFFGRGICEHRKWPIRYWRRRLL
jgi:ABC-type polysaccharide/polyol phosphate export permease